MTSVLPGGDYEALVNKLVTQLAAVRDVSTERVDRPRERLAGATGTTHQIDVLWDFVVVDGSKWRVLFEARSYRSRLKQSAVFAFDGVVNDIDQVSDRNCIGVMVTATGFQQGAKTVADSKGVLLLKLRKPTEVDMQNRIQRINLVVRAKVPFVENARVELYGGQTEGGWSGAAEVETLDGTRHSLVKALLGGRLRPLDDPESWRETVEINFPRGHRLVGDGLDLGELKVVVADIGESWTETTTVIGGRDQIAWMLAQSTGGFRVWFASNGRAWTTG